MMSRPPIIGDYVREHYEPDELKWLHSADIYRVTDVDNTVVKYVLVSEVTPVQKIRKFYTRSKRDYESNHIDFSKEFDLDVKSVYQAELDIVTKGWAPIMNEL